MQDSYPDTEINYEIHHQSIIAFTYITYSLFSWNIFISVSVNGNFVYRYSILSVLHYLHSEMSVSPKSMVQFVLTEYPNSMCLILTVKTSKYSKTHNFNKLASLKTPIFLRICSAYLAHTSSGDFLCHAFGIFKKF